MAGVKDHHQEIQDLENRVLCRTEKWGHEKQLGEPRNIKNIIYIYISWETGLRVVPIGCVVESIIVRTLIDEEDDLHRWLPLLSVFPRGAVWWILLLRMVRAIMKWLYWISNICWFTCHRNYHKLPTFLYLFIVQDITPKWFFIFTFDKASDRGY